VAGHAAAIRSAQRIWQGKDKDTPNPTV
jgi:hypothetical protein